MQLDKLQSQYLVEYNNYNKTVHNIIMIRSVFIRPLPLQSSTIVVATRRQVVGASSKRLFSSSPSSPSSFVCGYNNVNNSNYSILPAAIMVRNNFNYHHLIMRYTNSCNNHPAAAIRRLALRSTSSSSSSNKDTKSSQSSAETNSSSGGGGGEQPTSQEMVLTPGEKVVAGTRLFFWAGALSFASICAYYIGKELIPTKMSPNTIFDKATSHIRQNTEIKRRFGDTVKTYGRDHGGHREGRRNFIEHTEYTSPDDNTQRTRVRFNLEGPYGNAFVFAEVSKDMPSGEFVYILVQDKRNGTVITVLDNRSALLAKKLAGGDSEGQNVFSQLLGGGGGSRWWWVGR